MYDEINDDGAKILMMRVALQAAKDYSEAYRERRINFIRLVKLKRKTRNPKINHEIKITKGRLRANEEKLAEIEDFFRSEWGEECSGYPGDFAVNRLNERLRKECFWRHDGIWDSI